MAADSSLFCPQCASETAWDGDFCPACGSRMQASTAQRVRGTAFLLNEVHAGAFDDLVTAPQRQRIFDRYSRHLGELTGRRSAAAASPATAVAVARSMPRPAASPPPAPASPARADLPPRRPPPPRPSAPSIDWSWLAEQQANLFLFAGAFLVVVAALIYVGYSKQAVSGPLKMSLFVAYTLAFIAAGIACIRIPRVAIAGRVFLAVGMMLVPLNFVAASNIFRDEKLNAEAMWLAGSLTTVLLYSAVAAIGAGRNYALSAGIAVFSAAAAAVAIADVSIAWVALCFLAVCLAIAAADVVAPKDLRERLTRIWLFEAHAVAAASVAFAILVALVFAMMGREAPDHTRWFLPLTFAAALAYAAFPLLRERHREASVAALAMFAGVWLSLVYATHLPVEDYVVAIAALALAFELMALGLESERIARRLPEGTRDSANLGGVLVSFVGTGIAAIVVATAASSNSEHQFVLHTRWFLAPSAAVILCVSVLNAWRWRRHEGVVAAAAVLVALAASVVYGLDVSLQFYAPAIVDPALALALVVVVRRSNLFDRIFPEGWREDAMLIARASVPVGAFVALVAALALDATWIMTATFGLAAIFYALDALGTRERAAATGFAVSLVAAAAAVVFGLDVSRQFYAPALVAPAIALLALTAATRRLKLSERLATGWAADVRLVAHVATLGGCAVAVSAALGIDARWLAVPVFAMAMAFYALDAVAHRDRAAVAGFALASVAICVSVCFALGANTEYYAFAIITPALILVVAERSVLARHLDALLADGWRTDALALARAVAGGAALLASLAAIAVAQPRASYHPDAHWFLPVTFALVALFFALDASRQRRADLSAALVASVTGVAAGIVYVAQLDAEYYGVAFVATGNVFAAGGRLWSPRWLDARVRDVAAAIAVTAAWFAFENAYAHAARAGAFVHLSAALFYALAALGDTSNLTAGRVLGMKDDERVRLAAGWLYAAGLTLTLGYVFLLRGLPGGPDDTESGTLAWPVLWLALGFIAVAASTRWWRRDFAPHIYVMSLLLAVVSLAGSNDAQTLAIVLTSFIAAYSVAAVFEREPLLGAPAIAFGFAAVPAWRAAADAPFYTVPLAYSGIAIGLWASGVALLKVAPRWSNALRACGGLYALVAPAAGVGALMLHTHHHLYGNVPFERSLPYQATTLAVGLVGALAIAEAAIWRRGWALVGGTAIMVISVLLAVGRFHPGSIQPYTAILGAYLVALGVFGLGRLRLIPDTEGIAPWAEAAGAALIMAPSFLRSLDGGWWYQSVVLIEAVVFITIAVTLRRRALLAVALGAMVLVAARSLFDAIHALPNWIVIMLAGMALLGVGMGILVGRDRWTRWQDALVEWWRHLDKATPA